MLDKAMRFCDVADYAIGGCGTGNILRKRQCAQKVVDGTSNYFYKFLVKREDLLALIKEIKDKEAETPLYAQANKCVVQELQSQLKGDKEFEVVLHDDIVTLLGMYAIDDHNLHYPKDHITALWDKLVARELVYYL